MPAAMNWLMTDGRARRGAWLGAAALVALALWLIEFDGVTWLRASGVATLFSVDAMAVQHVALRLVGAGIVFGAIIYGTRFLQTVLRKGVLTSGRLDQGIAYSIDRAVGYAGLAFAILYAASFAGFDLTGLTVVAGALSVGVGFGLQTVISNFVCGLILLIERPIKVGDWVVVKDFDGVVKHISVRSTEILTGNGASILVPNSEFITGTVLNWTHGDPGGRVDVKVRVPQKSDPRAVLSALQMAAARTPGILAKPAPDVSFDGFGPEALDFSVGVHVANITGGGAVKTALRIAVLEEFRRDRIELALPQRQVFVRPVGSGDDALVLNGARPGSGAG
jgi:potassium-dependent mechanosensitive channel